MPNDEAVALPVVSYDAGNTITVTVDDPAARITSMTVHVLQFVDDGDTTGNGSAADVVPLFVYAEPT